MAPDGRLHLLKLSVRCLESLEIIASSGPLYLGSSVDQLTNTRQTLKTTEALVEMMVPPRSRVGFGLIY